MAPKTPESLWYAHPAPWPVTLARAALSPLSALYAAGAAAHRGTYALGLQGAARLGVRAVAVGNVVAGGAGKTPVVMALAQLAVEAGLRVAVLSRGYGAPVPKGGLCVGRGQGALLDAAAAGDEPVLMARRLSGVQVWVGPDRVATARQAVEQGAQVLLLDDAMQHHRVTVDALVAVVRLPRPLGNGWRLPAGPLREPAGALARADAVVLLGDAGPGDLEALGAAGVQTPRCAPAQLAPAGWLGLDGALRPLEHLRGQPVLAVAGIGRPNAFATTVSVAGARVLDLVPRADHAALSAAEAVALGQRAVALGAVALVTTEKDLCRWPPVDLALPVLALRVDLALEPAGAALLRRLVLGR